jgi:hypothetical protein
VALFEPVFDALERNDVRYVVVGGVAVVLRGHARLTADLDLAVDLSRDEAMKAVDTLVGLGMKPAERGMQVFSMWNPSDPMLSVALFVENPIALFRTGALPRDPKPSL